jgi:hypothetical protein
MTEDFVIDFGDDMAVGYSSALTGFEISIHVGKFRQRLVVFLAKRGLDPRCNLRVDFDEARVDHRLDHVLGRPADRTNTPVAEAQQRWQRAQRTVDRESRNSLSVCDG